MSIVQGKSSSSREPSRAKPLKRKGFGRSLGGCLGPIMEMSLPWNGSQQMGIWNQDKNANVEIYPGNVGESWRIIVQLKILKWMAGASHSLPLGDTGRCRDKGTWKCFKSCTHVYLHAQQININGFPRGQESLDLQSWRCFFLAILLIQFGSTNSLYLWDKIWWNQTQSPTKHPEKETWNFPLVSP